MKNRNLFLIVLEAGKSKMKENASGKGLKLHHHMVKMQEVVNSQTQALYYGH
jgi:hypothetical protein